MVKIQQVPGMLWTAVHTRPRCEKAVAYFCETHELTHYLPLQRQVKRYQRRNVETWLPMFRGYLFVQLSSEHYRLLASCCKVAHILSINQGEEKQLVEELRDIQRMEEISCSRDITVKPEIEAGQLVQVSCGPLQGTTGIVKKRGGRMRVTVNLEILGQSVSTDLDIGEVDVCTY